MSNYFIIILIVSMISSYYSKLKFVNFILKKSEPQILYTFNIAFLVHYFLNYFLFIALYYLYMNLTFSGSSSSDTSSQECTPKLLTSNFKYAPSLSSLLVLNLTSFFTPFSV